MFERALRRLLQRWWRHTRSLTLGARGIVIDGEGRLMMIRHTYQRGWTFPGGGVEFGETVETALHRELAEEVGVVVTEPPELFGIYYNHDVFPGDHVALYTVRTWQQTPSPVPNREIAAVQFFPPDDLPPDTAPGARRRVDELLGRRPRTRNW